MDPSWTDVVGAICAIIATAAAVATLVVAIIAARYAFGQWTTARDGLTAAREAEVAANQPAVSIFLDVREETPETSELVIRNYGKTGAHDIRTHFTPPLTRSSRGLSHPENAVVIVPTIPFLAPNEEWRTYWDSGPSRAQEPDLPNRYEGHVYYRGLNNSEQHNEVVLDFEPMQARIYAQLKRLRDVVKSIDALTGAVQSRR